MSIVMIINYEDQVVFLVIPVNFKLWRKSKKVNNEINCFKKKTEHYTKTVLIGN